MVLEEKPTGHSVGDKKNLNPPKKIQQVYFYLFSQQIPQLKSFPNE